MSWIYESSSMYLYNSIWVPISYVCTSAVTEHAANAYDIFYRETPHPEFGNFYFGVDGNLPKKNTFTFKNLEVKEDIQQQFIGR